MFNIKALIMISEKGERFVYDFAPGINYIFGLNGTGKSEFYKFLDYMLGASLSLADLPSEKEWFKGTLSSAELIVDNNKDRYVFSRTIDGTSFSISKNAHSIPCGSLSDYCEIMGELLNVPQTALESLWLYVGEGLQYRSMTVFNFLGETGTGRLDGFLEKTTELKYGVKLSRILDYIFNNHVQVIAELEKRIAELELKKEGAIASESASRLLIELINDQLVILRSSFSFTGRNIEGLVKEIDSRQKGLSGKTRTESVEGLRFAAESMASKIAILEDDINRSLGSKKLQENRKKLLEKLVSVAAGYPEYSTYYETAIAMIGEITEGASYSRLNLKREALKKYKVELKTLEKQLDTLDAREESSAIEQWQSAVSILNDAVSRFRELENEDLSQIREELDCLKRRVRELKSEDNQDKLDRVTSLITEYYCECETCTTLVKEDIHEVGYRIDFIKRGCTLRPSKLIEINEEQKRLTYIVGSFARHALIQLCGYVALLEFLFKEKTLPVLPMFLVDHPSKPFDPGSKKGIGAVLRRFVERNEGIQVFVFDSAKPIDLGVEPDRFIDLTKTPGGGFNPFFVHSV